METKKGDTYNGTLLQCDKFMNIRLQDVVVTNASGDKFHRVPEIQIKGSSLKYMRIQPGALQKAQEERPKYKNTMGSKHGKRRG